MFCRSQHLLNLPETKIEEFISKHVGTQPSKILPITCIATINRNSLDEDAVACPVIATETGHLYVLEPQAFSVVHQVSYLEEVPKYKIRFSFFF